MFQYQSKPHLLKIFFRFKYKSLISTLNNCPLNISLCINRYILYVNDVQGKIKGAIITDIPTDFIMQDFLHH